MLDYVSAYTNLQTALNKANNLLTDSTGGTASTTLASIAAGASYTQADMVAVKNALSSLAAAVNALIVVVQRSQLSANQNPLL
jgi:hypothetical protein